MVTIDKIIRSRRKTISLSIRQDGCLVVRAPLRTPEKIIQDMVNTKADWVQSRQKQMADNLAKHKPKEFKEGETFLFLGQSYPLSIVPQSREALVFDQQFRMAARATTRGAITFEKWYKLQAMKVISERTAWFAQHYGFTYKTIKISSARTRWGSCSSRGTLSFTWRLIMAPLSVIDYVIIHELVHTVEKNHARGFWDKVKALMPDYKQKMAWLKTNGHLLSLN